MDKSEDIQRVLQVKLNPSERDDRGREMSQAWDDYETIEGEKQEAGKQFTKDLKKKRAEIAKLAGILKVGTEPRVVMCRWVEDWKQNLRVLVRQDTGDTIETRAIPLEERQLPLEDLNS